MQLKLAVFTAWGGASLWVRKNAIGELERDRRGAFRTFKLGFED
jgi:hypothetical protein